MVVKWLASCYIDRYTKDLGKKKKKKTKKKEEEKTKCPENNRLNPLCIVITCLIQTVLGMLEQPSSFSVNKPATQAQVLGLRQGSRPFEPVPRATIDEATACSPVR